MIDINVLYINHENSLGGGTKSLLGLIDQLRVKDNVNIHIAIPSIGDGSLEKELISRNVNYVKKDYYWWMISQNCPFIKMIAYRSIKLIKNFISICSLIKYCEKNNIDLIHSNSMVIDIGGKISKKLNIKHVWHIREFGDDDHGLKFINSKSKSMKFMKKHSDKVVFISQSISEKYKIYFEDEKTEIIYNGVDYIDIKKNKIQNKDSVRILLAGAIKKSKGQEQAILAISMLVKKGYSVILELAGNEEDGYGDKLREIIKANKIEKNVVFLGFKNNLNEIRKDIDIELICSKKEAFGRVTVEAMMHGNVIVGSNTGATKELIEDSVNGFLYKEGDEKDLALKLELLLLNKAKRVEVGIKGREVAINKFTSNINSEHIYNVYRKVTCI